MFFMLKLKKIFSIICYLVFIFRVYSIIEEWVHPSETTTPLTERNLQDLNFPVIFKICPDPAFNNTLIQKLGYSRTFDYFVGQSKFNKSIYMDGQDILGH